MIRENGRYRVKTQRAMVSWSAPIVQSTEAAIKHLKIVGTMGFRDGALIQNISDSKTYLISKNRKRHIQSPDVYDKYGLNRDLIIVVSQEEANLHMDGEVLI